MTNSLARRLLLTSLVPGATAFCLCWSPAVSADAGTPTSQLARVEKPALSPLPKAPSIELSKPLEEELAEVVELLARFSSERLEDRRKAVSELPAVLPRWVPALAVQVNRIAEEADRSKMRALLDDLRSQARNLERKRMRAAGEKGKVITPDLLEVATGDLAKPGNATWKHLTQALAVSRLLAELGTVSAVRTLIRLRVRFGETLRIDTQLQLEKLGDKAVAALVESRRHKAPKIARWAEHQLDTQGKAIPSEAVKSADPQVLADVLRAFGRIRDPDAARIIVSFANSEHAQTREAARQAVVLLGEVSNWSLRDMYKNVIGKTPPRDWSWERSARELFSEFDRLRLAAVYLLFDQGMIAAKDGKHIPAKDAFDKVLARSPLFDRRSEMAPTYLAHAELVFDEDRAGARASLRRAARISKDPAKSRRIASLALTAEGLDLLDRGLADQVLFKRAIEADKNNRRAVEALARIRRGEAKKAESYDRYVAAGAIGFVALLALGFIGFRRGKPSPSATAAAPVPAQESEEDIEPLPQEEPEVATLGPKADESPADTPAVSLPADPEPTEEPMEKPAGEFSPSEPREPPGSRGSANLSQPLAPPEQFPPRSAPLPAAPPPTLPSDEPPALVLPTLVLPKPDGVPELPRSAEEPQAPQAASASTTVAPEVHLPAPAPSGPLATPSVSLPPLPDDDD